MNEKNITVLLVESKMDFSRLVEVHLQQYKPKSFVVISKNNFSEAMKEAESNSDIDVVVLDYFLPDKDGIQLAEELIKRDIDVPIIFLTANKDFDIALKAMKLGTADYILKEDLSKLLLPVKIVNIVENHRKLKQKMSDELNAFRLQTIREAFNEVVNDFEKPLVEMKKVSDVLAQKFTVPMHQTYIKIVSDNIIRISVKLEKLKNLKEAKSVKYIKDITMIDLS